MSQVGRVKFFVGLPSSLNAFDTITQALKSVVQKWQVEFIIFYGWFLQAIGAWHMAYLSYSSIATSAKSVPNNLTEGTFALRTSKW